MSVMLATLCINEMEWLPKLYQQHCNWPELVGWVFVEAADRVYAETNPDKVTSEGLSVDGTTDYLGQLEMEKEKVFYIQHGFSKHKDPAQGKCEARQRYLDVAEELKPEFIIIIDADEFYPKEYQQGILDLIRKSPSKDSYGFKHREIWYPPSLHGYDANYFTYEVSGGFWSIPYTRVWRWKPGLKYSKNHNTPDLKGTMLDRNVMRYDTVKDTPECVHMAFASEVSNREAKHNYYAARGEGVTDNRDWYVNSRGMWKDWKPGDRLPRGAKVSFYDGLIPEVFQ